MTTLYPTKNLLILLEKVIVTSHYHVGYDIQHRSNSSFIYLFIYFSNDIIEEAYSLPTSIENDIIVYEQS
jgi:hypothetical protein